MTITVHRTLEPASITAEGMRASLQALGQIDVDGAVQALEKLLVDVVLPTAAQVLGAIAPFFPEAKIPQVAILVLIAVIHGYETGVIKSADPEDPAMQNASGPENVSD